MSFTFSRVISSSPRRLVVEAADGNTYTVTGTRNNRNNNPGNIMAGSFANRHGAIGSDGIGPTPLAVFPDVETGRAAQQRVVFNQYGNGTILEMARGYAPRRLLPDGTYENDPVAYANTLAQAVGMPIDTPLSNLTEEQKATLLRAQSNLEGNVPQRVVDAQGNVVDLSGPPPGTTATAYNHVTDAQRTAMDALPPPPVNWSMGHPSSAGLTSPQFDPSNVGHGSTSSGAGAGSFLAPNETTWEMMSDPVAAPGRFTNAPSLPSDHFVPFSVNSSRAQSVSGGGYQSQPMPGAPGRDALAAGGTPLGAINSLVSGLSGPTPSAALGYAGDGSGGLGYGSPVMDTYRGAPAGGVSQPGYGDPRLQPAHYYSQGQVNAAPLSPFESAMAGVRSSVIPRYLAVTHHVPNPDYVAQFGPIEPPMPDFVGMLASRLSRDPNANAAPSFAQAPGDFGSSPVGQWGDYLLDKTPPPLPPAPPLPILQDPEAIRAILEPALREIDRKRALEAQAAAGSLASRG